MAPSPGPLKSLLLLNTPRASLVPTKLLVVSCHSLLFKGNDERLKDNRSKNTHWLSMTDGRLPLLCLSIATPSSWLPSLVLSVLIPASAVNSTPPVTKPQTSQQIPKASRDLCTRMSHRIVL